MIMRRLKRLAIVIVIAVMVVGFILVRLHGSGSSPDATSQSGEPSTSPSSTTSPSPGNATDGPSTSTQVSERKIVETAATDANALGSAAFLSPAELRRTTKQLVAPKQQAGFIAATQQSASVQIAETGYTNAADADTYAAYYVNVQKYRVEDVQEQSATVSLYVVTSWTTASQQLYQVPDILTIRLVRVGPKWFYYDSKLGNEPSTQSGLSFDQAVSRFQPYLKGFKDYDSANSAS
jgi:cytoskeletal protein RodZ